jgi:hypothetical protein
MLETKLLVGVDFQVAEDLKNASNGAVPSPSRQRLFPE